MRWEGQQGKSIYNKLVVISQVMKEHGKAKLLHAADWPSFVETVWPIYEDVELATLFNVCTPAEEFPEAQPENAGRSSVG